MYDRHVIGDVPPSNRHARSVGAKEATVSIFETTVPTGAQTTRVRGSGDFTPGSEMAP